MRMYVCVCVCSVLCIPHSYCVGMCVCWCVRLCLYICTRLCVCVCVCVCVVYVCVYVCVVSLYCVFFWSFLSFRCSHWSPNPTPLLSNPVCCSSSPLRSCSRGVGCGSHQGGHCAHVESVKGVSKDVQGYAVVDECCCFLVSKCVRLSVYVCVCVCRTVVVMGWGRLGRN